MTLGWIVVGLNVLAFFTSAWLMRELLRLGRQERDRAQADRSSEDHLPPL